MGVATGQPQLAQQVDGPGRATLPPILMTGPAPPLPVPVGEIQSVNGG
jgi:hypothetical protein